MKQIRFWGVMLIITALLLITTINCDAQSWNGITVGQSFAATKAQLLAKGFVLSSVNANDCVYSFKRNNGIGNNNLVTILLSPKTKTCWKLIVYKTNMISWDALKQEYDRTIDAIKQKYIYETYDERFLSPYVEGDGYEISAIKLDKCIWKTFYTDEKGNSIICEIARNYIMNTSSIRILYENAKASAIDDEERRVQDLNMY
jgi:hypothetical protein